MCSEIKVSQVTQSNDGGSLVANLEVPDKNIWSQFLKIFELPDELLDLPELLGKISSSTGEGLHVWS